MSAFAPPGEFLGARKKRLPLTSPPVRGRTRFRELRLGPAATRAAVQARPESEKHQRAESERRCMILLLPRSSLIAVLPRRRKPRCRRRPGRRPHRRSEGISRTLLSGNTAIPEKSGQVPGRSRWNRPPPGGPMRRTLTLVVVLSALVVGALALLPAGLRRAHPEADPLREVWLAMTGKPLAATAGARMFERGGNAVDAACAMLAATCTMWDTLGWGGETQALVFAPALRQSHRGERAGRRSDRCDGRVVPLEGPALPARVRPRRRGDPRDAGRAPHDARGVGEPLARGGPGAGDRISPTAIRSRRSWSGSSVASASASRDGRSRRCSSSLGRGSRRSPARCSVSPISRERSGGSSRPSAPRSGRGRAGRRRSSPRTSCSTGANSRRSSSKRRSPRARRSPPTISRGGA